MRSPVEKAIWYIESHFARDITLDELASACGLSRFQMSRLFAEAVGMTVTTYVRGRRLTEAARSLANGAPDILRVALQTGYGSHEAFSRAFRDQFGLTPAEVRAKANLDGVDLIEPIRRDPDVPVRVPPPRFETPGPLTIAGIGRRFPQHGCAGIPALWQEFRPHLGQIPDQKGAATYGVVAYMTKGGDSYFYLAGVEVSGLSDLDATFTAIRLPAQRWAVYAHGGHVTTIVSTINAIFGQELPAAGLAAGDMPDVLERYDNSFDPSTGDGGFEIWVPLK
jgi:AraC family transcriptional regulator